MLRSEIDFPPVPKIDRKRCPQCHSTMRLAWIEPGKKSGYDRRTFECMHCHHLDIVIVKI
jgi:transposase